MEISRKPPLAPALRAETAQAERRLSEHPSPETLAAYHERRLPASEREHLRDHLALCTDCAALLLDLIALAELDTPAEVHGPTGPADADMDTAWHALNARLGDGETPTAVASPASNVVRLPQAAVPGAAPAGSVAAGPVGSPRRRSTSWAWALAASWLAVAGLGFWVFELRQENARLAEPAVNAVIADLAASGDATRGGGEPKEQALPAHQRLLLILNAPDLPASAAGYEAEIREDLEGGAVVWTRPNVPRSADNNFTLDLPPGFLRSGKYQIVLYSADTGKRQWLADFPLRIGAP